MPDTQIHPGGVQSAPAAYVIPSAAELLLKMAYATFDGSAAATSFKPCLRIVSDAGSVAGEAVADDTVAAGGSADVTWFPRVGGGAAAPPSPSTVVMPYATAQIAPWVWPQPGNLFVDWTGATIQTTDPTVIANNVAADPGSPLLILKAGIYLAYGSIGPWDEAWGTQAELSNLGPDMGTLFGDGFLPTAFPLDFTPINLTSMMGILLGTVIPVDPPGGAVVGMEVNQISGADRTVSAFLSVLRLTADGKGV